MKEKEQLLRLLLFSFPKKYQVQLGGNPPYFRSGYFVFEGEKYHFYWQKYARNPTRTDYIDINPAYPWGRGCSSKKIREMLKILITEK